MVVGFNISHKLLHYSDLLRRVEGLLKAGRVDEALALIEGSCVMEEGADNQCPPRVQFLRGMVRLRQNDEKGMLCLFSAAERDPSLLADTADFVQEWLRGPGKAHDTPVLRGELARMRMVYDELAAERAEPVGREKLAAPEDWLLHAMEDALAEWRGEIKRAWMARRICKRAPHWRHHDMLLLMKPRLWHFLPGARKRMEGFRNTLIKALPQPQGTMEVRIYPFLALPAHMRNMRAHAVEMFTREDAPAPAPGFWRKVGRRILEPLKRAACWCCGSLCEGMPSVRLAVVAGLGAAVFAWPAWATWKLLRWEDTPRMVRSFEERHAAMMAARYWRLESAADTFAPEKTVKAFQDMLLAADDWPMPPVLDAKSRENWRKRRFLPGELRQLGWQWKGCGKPEVKISQTLAMARWPLEKPLCTPILLRREQGRWRVAWEETRLAFERNSKGWRLVRLPRGWEFGFAGWRFVALEGESGLRARKQDPKPEDGGLPGVAAPEDEKPEKAAPGDVARAEQGGHMAGDVRVWN